MYLVDTDILSTGAPGRRERSAALAERMDAHSDILFLSAITATAADRNLTVLTRNLRHFRPLGVPAMNPLETLPG